MSDEPLKRSRPWRYAALVLLPIGAIIGYFVAADYLCQPGDGHDCTVIGFMVGVPFGIVAGLICYLAVRAFLALR
jgi:hypothetical protein